MSYPFISLIQLVTNRFHFGFNFFHFSHFHLEVLFILFFLIFCLLIFVFFSLLFLEQTYSVRNPLVSVFLSKLPYMMILYPILLLFFSPQVKQIKNVVELIMSIFDVFFKAFKLKINFKSLLAANITIRFFVFFCLLTFLSQFRKLVNDCS